MHLGYKGINNIWLEGEEGDKLVEGYLNDLDACKANNIDMVVMRITSKDKAPAPSMVGIKRLQNLADNLKNANYLGHVILESCYQNDYLNMSLDHFYKRSMERAKQINL